MHPTEVANTLADAGYQKALYFLAVTVITALFGALGFVFRLYVGVQEERRKDALANQEVMRNLAEILTHGVGKQGELHEEIKRMGTTLFDAIEKSEGRIKDALK